MDKKKIFDLFKKVADEVAHGGEKLIQKVAEKLNDESMMHREALALYNSVQGILTNDKGTTDSEVKQSVENFLYELKAALEVDSESPTSKHPAEQLALTEKCLRIIHDNKSKLESETTLWNPIKVSISKYIKGITAIENAFETEHPDLVADEEFIIYKNSIADLKSKLSDI